MTTTEKEIAKNRKKFIKALIKDDERQCFGDLFDKGVGNKKMRCAVGVGLTCFFGVTDDKGLNAFMKTPEGRDPYGAVAAKLGIPSENRFTDEVSAEKLWRWNDRYNYRFRTIASKLAEIWDL